MACSKEILIDDASRNLYADYPTAAVQSKDFYNIEYLESDLDKMTKYYRGKSLKPNSSS